MIHIAGVAYNGSTVAQSTKSGHVTYEIWNWQVVRPGYCADYDEHGYCTDYREPVYDWVYGGTGNTNALITTSPVTSSSNVYVNGRPIATEGNQMSESWVANPPVPSSTSTTQYRNPTPGTSGSGTGSITQGNSRNVYANGKSVADLNSTVTTHLGTNPKITSGSSNVYIGG